MCWFEAERVGTRAADNVRYALLNTIVIAGSESCMPIVHLDVELRIRAVFGREADVLGRARWYEP